MFSPYDFSFPDLDYSVMKASLSKLRSAEAMMVIETWVNSWSTSYRYHEDPLLPCLFGCPAGIDKQAHYVLCPWLFFRQSLTRPETSPNPLERIAMRNPSVDSLKLLACSFAGYHAIKCTPTLCSIAVQSRTDHCAFLDTAVSFYDAFMCVARDVGLNSVSSVLFKSKLDGFFLDGAVLSHAHCRDVTHG